MSVTFRNDQPGDFLTILREVGQWLTDTNQEMWQLDTLTADNLFDEYTRDNCYVMYIDRGDSDAADRPQEPAATFILQWKDPLYYADVPDKTAGFIHISGHPTSVQRPESVYVHTGFLSGRMLKARHP